MGGGNLGMGRGGEMGGGGGVIGVDIDIITRDYLGRYETRDVPFSFSHSLRQVNFK